MTKDEMLDQLTEGAIRRVTLKIGKYKYYITGLEYGNRGFAVISVCSFDSDMNVYAEPHRKFIENNYQRELIEACV